MLEEKGEIVGSNWTLAYDTFDPGRRDCGKR
jgi:hypothetical protein